MDLRFRKILRKSAFDLSRLENVGGKLDFVTGLELIGMLLMAKQHGPLSRYKEIWSSHPIADPNGLKQKLLESMPPSCRTDDAQTPPFERIASPVLDATTPSPNPYVARARTSRDEPSFSLFRFEFAGLRVPILGVGYYRGKTTHKKICSYGGSEDGERCFLTSWEYESCLYVC